jgi:triacylglycerol esterase/lipase EstA (alpha/beta hydrolase family)
VQESRRIRRRPSPRTLRIWAIGLTPLLVVALVAAVVLVHRHRSADPVAQDRAGPVLLVPGYGGGTGALDSLAAKLRARGRTAVVVPPVGDDTGDLRQQARALARAADAQLAAGAPSVDVVGYSAGGVVVRIWAADDGGAAQARRIVTLGSPHHGTQVAALGSALLGGGCPTACQQLAPGSDLLSGLPETPAGPRWTSLWTAGDQVVTPPDSARLAGAVDVELQQICPAERVTHAQLPTDPLAVGLVERALATAPLTAVPPPSACTALRNAP